MAAMSAAAPPALALALLTSRDEDADTRAFDELAAWAAAHGGLALTRAPARSYEALLEIVRERRAELAWLPPVLYAWLAEAVTPLGHLVRDGATRYASALLVRRSSPLTSLDDLRDAKVRAGFVDRFSAAGFVVPRLELARVGLDPSQVFTESRFFGTHDDVLRALDEGACDLAATYARAGTAHGELTGPWRGHAGLDVRVLAVLGSIPPDVLVARRELPPERFEAARALFRAAEADAEGRRLLGRLFHGEALAPGIEPGHQDLRLAYERGLAAGFFD